MTQFNRNIILDVASAQLPYMVLGPAKKGMIWKRYDELPAEDLGYGKLINFKIPEFLDDKEIKELRKYSFSPYNFFKTHING